MEETTYDGTQPSPELLAFSAEIAPQYAIPNMVSDAVDERGKQELDAIQQMARTSTIDAKKRTNFLKSVEDKNNAKAAKAQQASNTHTE
jgi:hypothetical protein